MDILETIRKVEAVKQEALCDFSTDFTKLRKINRCNELIKDLGEKGKEGGFYSIVPEFNFTFDNVEQWDEKMEHDFLASIKPEMLPDQAQSSYKNIVDQVLAKKFKANYELLTFYPHEKYLMAREHPNNTLSKIFHLEQEIESRKKIGLYPGRHLSSISEFEEKYFTGIELSVLKDIDNCLNHIEGSQEEKYLMVIKACELVALAKVYGYDHHAQNNFNNMFHTLDRTVKDSYNTSDVPTYFDGYSHEDFKSLENRFQAIMYCMIINGQLDTLSENLHDYEYNSPNYDLSQSDFLDVADSFAALKNGFSQMEKELCSCIGKYDMNIHMTEAFLNVEKIYYLSGIAHGEFFDGLSNLNMGSITKSQLLNINNFAEDHCDDLQTDRKLMADKISDAINDRRYNLDFKKCFGNQMECELLSVEFHNGKSAKFVSAHYNHDNPDAVLLAIDGMRDNYKEAACNIAFKNVPKEKIASLNRFGFYSAEQLKLADDINHNNNNFAADGPLPKTYKTYMRDAASNDFVGGFIPKDIAYIEDKAIEKLLLHGKFSDDKIVKYVSDAGISFRSKEEITNVVERCKTSVKYKEAQKKRSTGVVR